MTWVSSPRHGMVANGKHHHFRHGRDQIHGRRTRSRSPNKTNRRTSGGSIKPGNNGGAMRRPPDREPLGGRRSPQKRKRSRSNERNGYTRDNNKYQHATQRAEIPSASSSSSRAMIYKDNRRQHNNDRSERATHFRTPYDSNNKVGDQRRDSSVLSPSGKRKSSASADLRRSSSRNRDIITSSSSRSNIKHHHQTNSSSHNHRHQNKQSALDNRDTSTKRDHASRSIRNSRPPPQSHHHKNTQQHQQTRREPSSTTSSVSTPVAKAVASSSSTTKTAPSELNGSRGQSSNAAKPKQSGGSVGGGSACPARHVAGPPDRPNISPQKKRVVRIGDRNGSTLGRGISHHLAKKRRITLPTSAAPSKTKFCKDNRNRNNERDRPRPPNFRNNEDKNNAKRLVCDKRKTRIRDSSVLFADKGKASAEGGGGTAPSSSSRARDNNSIISKQQHRSSSHNPRHLHNKPSALANRDTSKRDPECRGGRNSRSLSQSHNNQQQPRRDSSSSTSSLSTTVVASSSTTKMVLDELNGNNTADEYDELTKVEKWVRSAPDELYYNRQVDGHANATERTQTLCEKFHSTLLVKTKVAREEAEKLGYQKMTELIQIENAQFAEQKQLMKMKKQQRGKGKCCHGHGKKESGCESSDKEKQPDSKDKDDKDESASSSVPSPCSESKCRHSSGDSDNNDDDDSGSSSSSDSSSEDEDGFSMTRSDTANRELERRKKHPRRLHDELWHNDPGLMNDGPVCRCSAKARRFGIRHGFYPGEERISPCDHFSNNKNRLYHYKITISPPKNFLISTPTVINHDGHEYIFEGFSIFSHYQLDLSLPPCKVIRFNIKYDVFVEEEKFPESFCVKELLLFETYLFREILELVDLKYDWSEETGCSQFHLMPRFVRHLPDNGQEILSMSRVLIHLLKGDRELVKEEDLHKLYTVEQSEWQNFADRHKGTIVTKWGMKPCAIRVDQIDRDITEQEVEQEDGIPFPLIVHFGIRPPQLSYAGNAGYQRAWRRYVKYRHLLSNMPKPSPQDKLKLLQKEMKLQAMRTASNMKRDVTVAISSKGFRTTGICCDLVQHAMLIPVLVAHLRFHKCLETLERCMVYPFQNRYLLQLAMTHPSYRENFGTNPDHARNALTNCGIRQPEYGDRRIHYASTRKRGINTLINIMAKFGADQETESEITHNERLEFLGDAVVEFTTSIHLFHIFPDLEEGGLATYRAAIVQNQHLAVLAQALNLDQYMLYAHGSDLCHDSELRHAMANCFEALMGALFLDGGIEAADRVFGSTLFGTNETLLTMWAQYPRHPLQQEETKGDRHWVKSHEVLQKLAAFETSIGVQFNHIRLLARAFTDRSLGYNNLTKGSNQRLEFLGDTVLQLISSEYLYRHFPDHHEGHLSLLRSSLVNNRTQSLVCEDLAMPQYAMRGDPKSEMKTKDKADLLEAFLGALYIDKGLKYCILFCQVCFFPRLSNSITKQEWNDPKSKLQQCCLTLRAMDGREPDIPVYKVTESLGPTNTRTYIVAVYFRGKRLATAQGHSIQEAEMNAAAEALEVSGHLFPQLHHQRKIMDKTKKSH